MVVTGIYYALFLAGAGALLGWFTKPWAGIPFYILAGFCLWFFRDPDRTIPTGDVAVSPADGKVVLIKRKPESTRVCIFLNVFDVHVNRSPIAGKVVDVEYKPGKFLVASKEEASTENEMNTITVDGHGTVVTFSQIAGLIARRIVCYKKPGDFVTVGERIGLIKFGSRVDITFGPEWQIVVQEGQRVSAGSSVVARLVKGPKP
ncbi:MAG: phosphatidylserine decarboxylase [Candidatus Solibacter usitatus]|nr:phosphatidylserine decarboxylase [Candidatus Solibacter usitatus]